MFYSLKLLINSNCCESPVRGSKALLSVSSRWLIQLLSLHISQLHPFLGVLEQFCPMAIDHDALFHLRLKPNLQWQNCALVQSTFDALEEQVGILIAIVSKIRSINTGSVSISVYNTGHLQRKCLVSWCYLVGREADDQVSRLLDLLDYHCLV